MSDPIKDAAQNVLDVLGENTEDIIEEASMGTWPGGDEAWFEEAGSPEAMRHSDRVFAKVCRALIPLLESAALAADERATPAPKEADRE